VAWEGALQGRLIALKGSPIWQALANGAGGYQDTLGHPFPPFAFHSGMDWAAVKRARCIELGLDLANREIGVPRAATFAPHAEEVTRVLAKLGPDFKAQLLASLRKEAQAA
jgi:hypothetical protein